MSLPGQLYTRQPGEDGPGWAEGAGDSSALRLAQVGPCGREVPYVWYGWTPMGERGAPRLARLGPLWEAAVPCAWHGSTPARTPA